MLLQSAKIAFLLVLLIHYTEGVIVVRDTNDHGEFFSDGIAGSTTSNGSYFFENSCCIYGNCTCLSLYNALANLTSNVLINITTDVELPSITLLLDLANITITGHNNPTVNCNNSGGLHFKSCYNCTIEGITWEQCGTRNIRDHSDVYPVLQLFNSSEIIIKNCSFQHSIGQAIVLSGMLGDVNIYYCNFLFNKQYAGHGTAIHYSSNSMSMSSPFKIMIANCNFLYNGKTKSVVYFGQSSTKLCEYLNLQDCKFHQNKATSIYLTKQNLYINGNIEFYKNAAENGGGLIISDYSSVTFHKSATVNFTHNTANNSGGAIFLTNHSSISFKDQSTLFQCHELYHTLGDQYLNKSFITATFYNNTANMLGQHIYAHNSSITIGSTATVSFMGDDNSYCNYAHVNSAFYVEHYSTITIEGNSTVTFDNNEAGDDGGNNGGAMYINDHCTVTFEGNSTVTFNSNVACNGGGGAMYVIFSTITLKGNTVVTFNNNTAFSGGGGAVYTILSTITAKENSKVLFHDNVAFDNGGGAIYISFSTVTFESNSLITFNNNGAYNGGAMYSSDHSDINFKGNTVLTFYNNTAYTGGAYYIHGSFITSEDFAFVTFNKNKALQDGGAIYLSSGSHFTHLDDSEIYFYNNSADNYGGAAYILLKGLKPDIRSYLEFEGNTAGKTPKAIYISIPRLCDRYCLKDVINVEIFSFTKFVSTSQYKVALYNPTKCINGSVGNCDTYYMNNIMLGQEITFDACVLDLYDQPTEAVEFSLTGMNHADYRISGSKYITISCNHTIQGTSITGNLYSNNSYNYSIIISSSSSESQKLISVKLTIELSQCHPGFWYSSELQKCECYNTNNIISCTGSISTIKRGYWFGTVTGRPTVTSCPNDYCNFTCCEITNGIYHLSPVRANQCRLHRSGTACGGCEKDYTLSFDSPECVEINKCTIGQTVLVTTISLLYWIAVVVTVFTMAYFKVSVGTLYGIIYYYSVVDILLSPVLYISNVLYMTVNIMSSLTKLTPRFLGQLCLVRYMSGIDQQFIHYAHPAAVSFILVMISMLARRSHTVSLFISRGVIRFICFLLLLSYTSVATTSLLLMRPLKFINIDKVYTYLSPDIEYFHGRHIAYIIGAIILTLVIVIGFPLLLLLEPFLNSKINFFRIKPLLDQFQGCYKDKYRYFAGYYMICRLVIILLVIVKLSDDFTTQYVLISLCALMVLIHVLVRPYVSTIHNIFDGILLQCIVIISVLPMVEFVGNYDKTFVVVIAYLLVILPLTSFIAVELWINRDNIQHVFEYLIICLHVKSNKQPISDTQGSSEIKEFDTVIDDEMRKNAIIVDM